jgi:hypothetical protein
MSNKKGDKDMQTATEVTDTIADRSAILSLKQVHNYTDLMVERGYAEYNKGSILVKSKQPLDECLRRGIIEEEHHEAGKRFRNYRDCAVSKSSGRVYNAVGEGDPDMDAGTIYANVIRYMNENLARKRQWNLIAIICFAESDINGNYLSEADYGALYRLAPNIRYAFEIADEAFSTARKMLQDKLEAEKKRSDDAL